MGANPHVADVVSLLGGSSRTSILTSLMDGRYHTASELAYAAAIKPQTASFHLAKLIEGNLIVVEKYGRHRYYHLAGQKVAEMLETFLTVSPPADIRSLNQSDEAKALRRGRTCYDHLAGYLGVSLTNAMINYGYLERGEKEFLLTSEGEYFLTDFGINLPEVRKKRRYFSRVCLDWSERHHHLAGALGQAIAEQLFNMEWIVRMPSTRAVKVTDKGLEGLKQHFHIDM